MNNWQHSSYNSFHSAIALVAGGAPRQQSFSLRVLRMCVPSCRFRSDWLRARIREILSHSHATWIGGGGWCGHDCWIFDEKRMRILNAYCVFLSQVFYANTTSTLSAHTSTGKIVFIAVIVYAHTLIDRNEYFSERKRREHFPHEHTHARKRFERTKHIFRTHANSINFFRSVFLCANYR